MAEAEDIAEVLEPSHMVAIILYVHGHPGCMRSDVYREVTRNANTLWKLRLLEARGILDMSQRGSYNSCLLRLTDRGERVAELLTEIGKTLGNRCSSGPGASHRKVGIRPASIERSLDPVDPCPLTSERCDRLDPRRRPYL